MLTVEDVGQVHDYERYAEAWDEYVEFFAYKVGDMSILRGWTIALERMEGKSEREAQEGFGGPGAASVVEATYLYRIRGYHAVNDKWESGKKFTTLTLQVLAALNAEPNLHSSNREGGANGIFYGPPVHDVPFDFRMFGDIVCHYSNIVYRLSEVLQ